MRPIFKRCLPRRDTAVLRTVIDHLLMNACIFRSRGWLLTPQVLRGDSNDVVFAPVTIKGAT